MRRPESPSLRDIGALPGGALPGAEPVPRPRAPGGQDGGKAVRSGEPASAGDRENPPPKTQTQQTRKREDAGGEASAGRAEGRTPRDRERRITGLLWAERELELF